LYSLLYELTSLSCFTYTTSPNFIQVMTLLHSLSYLGAAAAFIFVTLSLASGLLWISELIEEHSRIAKVIGQRGIYVIIILHVLLYFYDALPLAHVLFSIFCHAIYLRNFTASWPLISLSSMSFLASCILVITDHFIWFFYFAHVTQEARHRSRTYRIPAQTVPGFAEIATFFGVCVWLAPLFLFLSLSANDNALPLNIGVGADSVPNTPTSSTILSPIMTKPRTSLFKSLFDSLPLDSIPSLRPKPKRKDTSQGIIAPHISRPPSPLPSPNPSGLRRVPSMNLDDLPPPPSRSPVAGRRPSTESPVPTYSTIGSSYLSPEPKDVFNSQGAVSLIPFTLGAPPIRRVNVGPSRRSTVDGRLEMRRAVSAAAALDGNS